MDSEYLILIIHHSSFPTIFRIIIIAFGDSHIVQMAICDMRFEEIPENNRNILGGWDNSGKFRHIVIKVLVIYLVENNFVDKLAELFKVNHISSFRVRLSGHRHLNSVIMPVAMHIIALIEYGFVF